MMISGWARPPRIAQDAGLFASFVLCVGAACLALLVGWGVASEEILTVLPAAPIVLVGLLQSSLFRFTFVTVGGLVALQSSSSFDPIKLAYFSGTLVALGIAALRTHHHFRECPSKSIKALIQLSVVWIVLSALSLPVAMINGSFFVNWIRDIIPYLLFATVPFFAIDVAITSGITAAQRRKHTIVSLFVIYGLLTTLSFFARWVTSRGYGNVNIDVLSYSSIVIPAALFSFAVARVMSKTVARMWWSILAGGILTLLILTGTRTVLLFLVGPLAMIFIQGRQLGSSIARAVSYGLIAVIVGIGVFSFIPDMVGIDTSNVERRFTTISEITSESSVAGQSYESRAAQTSVMTEAFLGSPVTGVGPGHVYTWQTFAGATRSGFVLDSPMSIPAKFGVLGVLGFLYSLYTIFMAQKRCDPSNQREPSQRNAMVGFLGFSLALSLTTSPIENKGFSFALAFLLAITLVRAHDPALRRI